jgi:hypothetical protein
MGKALVVLAVALTLLLIGALPASAGTGWLEIHVVGPGDTSTTPGKRDFHLYMHDNSGAVRCKKSGADKVTVTSSAFDPPSQRDDTDKNGLLVLHTTVKANYGTKTITATCRGWKFSGNLGVKSSSMASTGVPALPTAVLGLLLIMVGAGLLHLARVRWTEDPHSSDGTAAG